MVNHEIYFLLTHSLSNFLVAAYAVWVFEEICSKVLSPLFVKLFRLLEASLIIYLLLRTLTVAFIETLLPLYHACWYGMYPCFFVSAFATVCITWLINKSKDIQTFPLWLKLLAVFNIICSLIVLTNDYHNLCFSFEPNGKELISHNEIFIGPIKTAIVLEYFCAILQLTYLSYKSGFWRKKLLVPATVIVPATIYAYLYNQGYQPLANSEHVAINSFFVILFWQLAAKTRLFPCYGYYTDIDNIPSLESEAIYRVRKRLTKNMEYVLKQKAPTLTNCLNTLQSKELSEEEKRMSLHTLKLTLSFIKKHILLYLQAETLGYIKADDFALSLKEELDYAIEAGCNIFMLPLHSTTELSTTVLEIHRAFNDILQETLSTKPDGLLLSVRQEERQLILSCTAPAPLSEWFEKLGQELSKKYDVNHHCHTTLDGTFLTLSTMEVSHD